MVVHCVLVFLAAWLVMDALTPEDHDDRVP